MNDLFLQKKLRRFEELFFKHGDFELFYQNKVTGLRWSKWKFYSECSNQEKKQANQRSIFRHEIVLDFEEKIDLEELQNKLAEDGIFTYEVWDSGSRGIHIHIFFEEMKKK